MKKLTACFRRPTTQQSTEGGLERTSDAFGALFTAPGFPYRFPD